MANMFCISMTKLAELYDDLQERYKAKKIENPAISPQISNVLSQIPNASPQSKLNEGIFFVWKQKYLSLHVFSRTSKWNLYFSHRTDEFCKIK